MRDISDLLPFLALLDERRQVYTLEFQHPDYVRVTIHRERKLEVDFAADRVEFAVSHGDGVRHRDIRALNELIDERGR
ncbi:MAG: hypothetical protein U1E56_02300 [Bauldia sp.]